MLASVDPYLSRRYDRRRYNCMHFACDVWADATGEDLTAKLAGLFDPATRRPSREHLRAFERLPAPVDPCLVVMRGAATHVGVYLRGKVLHLSEAGAAYQTRDVAMLGFTSARFYR